MDHVRKGLVALVAGATLALGLGVGSAEAKGLDCTVLLFKPTHFWRSGTWAPKKLGGLSTREWMDACEGRYKVRKKGPDVGPGHWTVRVSLNGNNCAYYASENLKDWGWWKEARIVVS